MRSWALLLATTAFVLVAPMGAQAGLVLYLDDGATQLEVSDGDMDGIVSYVGAFGAAWSVDATGFSSTYGALPGDAEIDLFPIAVTSSAPAGTHTLTLWLSDTDFDLGVHPNRVFTSAIGGTTGGTVNYSSYYDPTNETPVVGGVLPANAVLLAQSGPLSTPAFGWYDQTVAGVAGPFSLLEVVTITHTGGATTSLDANLLVPEPGTVTLLGLAFLTLGFVTRRRAGR